MPNFKKTQGMLLARADDILNKREFTPEDKEALDEVNAKLDLVCSLLAREGEEEEEEEKGEEEKGDEDEMGGGEERKKVHAPAYLRSRGRQSVDTIHDHAKREGYSVSRAALSVAENRSLRGVEAEVNQELTRNGSGGGNFRVPCNLDKLNRRDLTSTTGAGAIPVYTDGADFVEWLYPKLIGPQLGFDYMPGLKAGTKLPRTSAIPTVQAVAEQSAATASSPGIDYVILNPHTLTANVTISKLFATQSVVAADRYVMNNGSTSMAVQLDQWSITGSGLSNQPYGLLNNTAFTQTHAAASNTVAYTDVLKLERDVAKANANFGNLRYLTSPDGYMTLQETPKIGSTYPVFIISEDGRINGKDVVNSSQVPNNLSWSATSNLTTLIYGAWQFLVVALFGDTADGIDVVVDPFTGSKAGDLTITFLMLADTNLTKPQAFSAITNIGYNA